jgi:hypothetical protein
MGAHKCPKCAAPIEKNEGCSHMSCVVCHHRWCWVCGLPLNHWSHKMSEVLPFSCKTIPKTFIGWIGYLLLFLLGFAGIPLFIVLMANLGAFYCTFAVIAKFFCRCTDFRRPCRNGCNFWKAIVIIFLYMPIYILLIALALTMGLPFSALCLVLTILPAYVFHIFYFVRSCVWWSRSQRVNT